MPQVHVDAAESLANRRRDRRLECDFIRLDRLQDAIGNFALGLNDFDAAILHIPIDFDAGGLDAFAGGFSDFWADAVARNQSHSVHLRRFSQAVETAATVADESAVCKESVKG